MVSRQNALRAVLLGILVAGILVGLFGRPAAPAQAAKQPKCAGYTVRVGGWGQCSADAKWLLAGHKPSVFRLKVRKNGRVVGTKPNPYYSLRVRQGKTYTFKDALATREMRYRLGFPCGKRVGKQRRCSKIRGEFGPVLRNFLLGRTKFRPLKYRLTAANRRNAYIKKHTKLVKARSATGRIEKLMRAASWGIAHAGGVHYSQTYRMGWARRNRLYIPVWEDCSSSVTGLYRVAGLPDPNGLGYNGYGYTGTQSRRGTVVWRAGQSLSRLQPGDLIFYGGGWPYSHVAMYIGSGRVFSHGSEGGPYNLPALYRLDSSHARRYR